MTERILKFSEWAQANWLALVVFMVLIMLTFVCAIMLSWLYGYWSNALFGTKFDLTSCWSGITVVIAGLGGVGALAKAGWTKYKTDSEFNTANGEKPY